MMAYTGANVHPSGETGFLTSPVRHGTAKTECVNFWYHMGGVNPGKTPLPSSNCTQAIALQNNLKLK